MVVDMYFSSSIPYRVSNYQSYATTNVHDDDNCVAVSACGLKRRCQYGNG
jgi:hypothetical protein